MMMITDGWTEALVWNIRMELLLTSHSERDGPVDRRLSTYRTLAGGPVHRN